MKKLLAMILLVPAALVAQPLPPGASNNIVYATNLSVRYLPLASDLWLQMESAPVPGGDSIVTLSFHGLVLGSNYELYASSDLVDWAPVQAGFVASADECTNTFQVLVLTHHFFYDSWEDPHWPVAYFRLYGAHQVPGGGPYLVSFTLGLFLMLMIDKNIKLKL